ncbi:MAG: hypothetical protein J6H31_13470 [Butyrivibrio sp.]|nr:hypothetical protein [Butyrivibrio sp.]
MNLLVCLLVYVQSRQIVRESFGAQNEIWQSKLAISLAAFFITITINSINQINSYYVDMMTLPIILFFICEFLHGRTYDKNKLLFMAWCISLEVCLKFSAGIPLILMLLYFVITERNNLKFSTYVIGICLAMLALLPYAYSTYIETKSPLFPFMNQVFQSDLFLFPDDTKYIFGEILTNGPKNLLESLLLPISVLLKHSKMMSSKEAALFLVSVSALIYMLCKWKLKDKLEKRMAVLFGLFYILWIGVYHCFNRYNPGMEITLSLIMVMVVWRLWAEKKFIFDRLVFYGLIITILANIGLFFRWGLWTSNPVYRNDTYRNANVSMILNDRQSPGNNGFLEKVNSWLAIPLQPVQGYEYMLKHVPIVCLDGYAPFRRKDYDAYKNGEATKIYSNLMDKYVDNGMYCIVQTMGHVPVEKNRRTIMSMVLDRLLQSGYVLQDITAITPNFIREGRNISIGEVRRKNKDCILEEYVLDPKTTKAVEKKYDGQVAYDMYIALFPDKKEYGTVPQMPFNVVVKMYDENDEVADVKRYSSQGEYVNIRLTTDKKLEIIYENQPAVDIPLMVLCYEKK